jgi:hypothetical protein
MPDEAIRYIHEADKPADKLRLFKDCISGKVSVLVGSTEKMGTDPFCRGSCTKAAQLSRSISLSRCATGVADNSDRIGGMNASKIE